MVAFATDLGPRSPYPDNSSPAGAHVFYIRAANSLGNQPRVQLAAYFDSQPNGSTITLAPGAGLGIDNVCKIASGLNGTDANRYISVTIENDGGSNQRVYHIPHGRACVQKNGQNSQGVDGSNAFYASYEVPFANLDPVTNMHKVNITIAYNSGLSRNDDFAQRFNVFADGPGAMVGQLGGDVRNFALIGDWNNRDDPTTRIEIPFGLPCNVTQDRTARIGIYDADNGFWGSRNVTYFVQRDTGSGWQTINMRDARTSGPAQEGSVNGNNEYRIPDGNAADVKLASTEINLQPNTRYRMVIYDLAPRNTIDVRLPDDADTIFGVIGCERWRIRPDSSITTTGIRVGDGPVDFTHSVKNVGNDRSDNVTSTVRWSAGRTGVIRSDTFQYIRNQERNWTNSFTPTMADVGRTICQNITATPWKWDNNSPITSTQVCVLVFPPAQTPDRIVTITPSVPNNPVDIEPTEWTTLTGQVAVSGFPSYQDWGYTEYSVRRDSVRQPVQASGGVESQTVQGTTRSSTTSSQNTTYSCPHPADTRNGQSCRHARSGYQNQGPCTNNGFSWDGSCYSTHPADPTTTTTYNTVYYCDPGYYPVGSGSSKTCWRTEYRCTDPLTGWQTSPPYCPIKYTCPGQSIPDYSTGQPRCNEWRCPYSSAIIFSSTQPLCEFRCNNGTGAVAYAGSGSYASPCYREPSFSLTCRWVQTNFVWTETVRSNGTYCATPPRNQITRQGVAIGVNICASLTFAKPFTWSPDPPRPGYGNGGSSPTAPYSQQREYGWSNPSTATGCTRVVGKPTVKVNGGDVATGGWFRAANNACYGNNPGASIAAWPNAAGGHNGAGTELGAFAPSNITGFSSAALRTGLANPPSALTFANTPSLGNFGPAHCIANQYALQPPTLQNIGSLNSIGPTDDGAYRLTGGGNSMGATTIGRGNKVAVYATGNVHINGNVLYDRSGWASVADIPAFKLVVNGGNIYIRNDVTQLNGIFVAQPIGGTGGNIYTCSSNTSEYSGGSLYSNCQQLLTVNGVFVARKTHLLRTLGTQIFSGQPNQVAEQFNYLPELWLANWPRSSSSTDVKYDAITNLPPTL